MNKQPEVNEERFRQPVETDLSDISNNLESAGIIDNTIANDLKELKPSDQSAIEELWQKLKNLPNGFSTKRLKEAFNLGPSLASLILVLELLVVSTALAKDDKPGDKKLIDPTTLHKSVSLGKTYSSHFGNESSEVYFKNNLKRPKSFADLGKMFVEPATLIISQPTDNNLVGSIARIVLGEEYEKGKKQTTIDFSVAYEYAQDYQHSDPKDQEKMKEDLRQVIKELLEKLTPMIFGVSFQKDNLQAIAEKEARKVNLKSVKIEGYASPEDGSPYALDHKDVRNENLSKLRAENAAQAFKSLFNEYDLGVDDLSYQGKGEEVFSDVEKERLAELSKKVKIELPSGISNLGDAKLVSLIKRYNQGEIKDEQANKELEEMLGKKRKVEIAVTVENHRVVLVLPIPYILLALAILVQIPWTRRQREERRRRNLGDVQRRERPVQPSALHSQLPDINLPSLSRPRRRDS